jgi:hypothetical protein
VMLRGDAQTACTLLWGLLTTATFSGVRSVFTLSTFFFSVEPVVSKFRTQVLLAWADETVRL